MPIRPIPGSPRYTPPAFQRGAQDRVSGGHYIRELADIAEASEARVKELEAGEISTLREARAETWDEAISAVFAWWSAPPERRPAGIVNPYGAGLPVESEGTDD